MTIRDYFNRKHRTLAGAIVLLGAWLSYWGRSQFAHRHESLSQAMLVLGGVAMIFVVISLYRKACPRCSKPLVKILNPCPHCGVSFDEPYTKP